MVALLRFKRIGPAAVLAVIGLLVALSPASPAAGHAFELIKMDDATVDFGSDEDNNDHHLFWNHFMHFQMIDEYQNRTDLSVVERCKGCWTNSTDVVWFATGDLAANINADEACRATNANGTCNRARVRFNQSLTRTVPGNTGFFLACHEVGHAVGFNHLADGCMHDPINRQSPPQGGQLSGHMINHINERY
jgi:hypothetical protein